MVTPWWRRLDDSASWSDRSAEERAHAIEGVCRAAIQLLEAAPNKKERLDRVDPVPPSTRTLLRRLVSGHNA